MIDVRQRDKTAFEHEVINKSHKLDFYDLQIAMFDNANYGYFVTSFYGEFILQDETIVKTMNHFIKCSDDIYFFIEEIVDGKYDDLMWYRRDHTQKLHLKAAFKKQNNNSILTDFISNIKEIDNELSVLKLIRIFGEYSEHLTKFECDKNPYITICHSLLLQKFDLQIPNFDEYNEEYKEVTEFSEEIRNFLIKKDYERISILTTKEN